MQDEQGADAPQQVDLIGLLFSRLEGACITLGQQQMASRVAMQKAQADEKNRISAYQVREEYLMEQLKQTREATPFAEETFDVQL